MRGGGIFNNSLLFSLLSSGTFCGGQGLDGGRQSRDRGIPPSGTTIGKILPSSHLKKIKRQTMNMTIQ